MHTPALDNVSLPRRQQPYSCPLHARRLPLLLLLLILTLLLTPHSALAQDDDPPQSETERRAAEDTAVANALKAAAEARKAAAEARKAEQDARFPQSDIKTLEGKTTLAEKDPRVEEQLAGHISVAQAANRIAASLHTAYPHMTALLIYNEGDIQALLVYSAATKRIDTYSVRYSNLAAAESAALAADPIWTGPNPPCDEASFARAEGLGGAGLINPLGVATSVLGSFGEILSFFRTDVSIQGSTFTVGEPVIVTEVFRALRSEYKGSIALYYPSEIPPGFDPTRDSQVIGKLEALFNSKANAEAIAAQISRRVADKRELIGKLRKCQGAAAAAQGSLQKIISDQQKKVDDLVKAILQEPKGRPTAEQKTQLEKEEAKLDDIKSRLEPRIAALRQTNRQYDDDIGKLEKQIAALQAAVAPLAALNAQTDLLAKDIVKVNETTGLNPLTAFIRAEMIQKFMQENDAYWLKLRVVVAGGNTKVKTNLIVDVFNGGNRIWYSGASIVEYHLYDRLGRSLLSDTTNSYEDYKKAKDVKKLTDNRAEVDQP